MEIRIYVVQHAFLARDPFRFRTFGKGGYWNPITESVNVLFHLGPCLPLTPLILTTLLYPQNASFSVPWLGVSGLGSVSRSPLSLLELAGACCSPSPLGSTGHTQLYRACSSFAIFLRLLALHLSQENAGGAPWRQIKGRLGNASAAAANAAD